MSVLIGSIASSVLAAEGASPYTTAGRCDGLPKISVTTSSGVCVGLLASGFKFPRGVLPLDDGDVMVVDMGGWTPKRGSLWLLRKASGYQRERVLDKLDRPHGIVLGPDRRIYLGVAGGVVRFDPAQPRQTLRPLSGATPASRTCRRAGAIRW